MNALVLNSGSSSLKFKVFNTVDYSVLLDGEVKNYSEESISVKIGTEEQMLDISKWSNRLELVLTALKNIQIDAVLHRIVHGSEIYALPIVLNNTVLERMKEEIYELAPLHNPPAFEIIEKSFKVLPMAKQIAVFDSAFGLSMPPANYLYALPLSYYKNYKVRRFAFHGISHKYVSESYRKYIINDQNNLSKTGLGNEANKGNKIISIHLGSGSSVCAIKDTQCVDTSFGFTPEENIIMATRVGEIDYSAIEFIKKRESLSDKDITILLNTKSGLLGLSGYTKDMKVLLKDYNSNPQAKLAIDMFVNSVVKQILNMVNSLRGVDVLIFTGGIGQGSDIIRQMICERLDVLRIYIDVDKNVGKQDVKDILNVTRESCDVEIFVIPTNEELEMLKESIGLLS